MSGCSKPTLLPTHTGAYTNTGSDHTMSADSSQQVNSQMSVANNDLKSDSVIDEDDKLPRKLVNLIRQFKMQTNSKCMKGNIFYDTQVSADESIKELFPSNPYRGDNEETELLLLDQFTSHKHSKKDHLLLHSVL